MSPEGHDLILTVDGVIYQMHRHGGISRLYTEILPRMCDMDESLRIRLLTTGKLRQRLPTHPRIFHQSMPHVKRYLRPGRLWKPIAARGTQLVRTLWIGRGEGQIWHSTYYTLPEPWAGLQVVTVVDLIHERFPHLFDRRRDDQFREQKRRCIEHAEAVICISETTRLDVLSFFDLDSDRIYVLPLACSDVFRQVEQRDDGLEKPTRQRFLLYVGDRRDYKNFDGLTQAYSVWSRRKEVALVVVGRPWLAHEERRLAELGIWDCVSLLTDVDDDQLCRLYNQAAVFVYPSLYEGFGMPLLEAMACGCPVVASRIPSAVEVGGQCPIYFEPGELESILAALDVALSEGRESQRVRAGLERTKSYSWDRAAAQTLEVYRALAT